MNHLKCIPIKCLKFFRKSCLEVMQNHELKLPLVIHIIYLRYVKQVVKKKKRAIHFINGCDGAILVLLFAKSLSDWIFCVFMFLRVFCVKNLNKIIEKYILKRWTKDAKRGMMNYE